MKNNLNMAVVRHWNPGLALPGKMAFIRVDGKDLVDLHAFGFSLKHLEASRQIPNFLGSVLHLELGNASPMGPLMKEILSTMILITWRL